jgi:dTDP-4-amino-4,6-dideoxygalactose transaminase
MEDFIPIARVGLGREEIEEVVAVLRSGWLTTGPRTKEFERQCREYLGCRHVLAVNSCTAALHLALSAIDLKPDDEVITSPLTFPASVNSILYVGATPVLADVDPATLNLSPNAVLSKLTPKTKAIVVVHYAGAPAEMDEFRTLANERGLTLVEDAAQAMGATYKERHVGSDSRMACFSFHPAKNITTGEGGILATDDDEVEKIARLRSWHGIDRSAHKRYREGGSWYYEVQELGFKYNMTDIQAAIGLHQLRRLDDANRERRQIASDYDDVFRPMEHVRVAPERPYTEDARNLYWMVLNRERHDRSRFIEALKNRKVGSGVHFILVHMHPYYRRRFGWSEGLCPEAERAYRGLVSVPLWHGMSSDERQRVIDGVVESLRESRV